MRDDASVRMRKQSAGRDARDRARPRDDGDAGDARHSTTRHRDARDSDARDLNSRRTRARRREHARSQTRERARDANDDGDDGDDGDARDGGEPRDANAREGERRAQRREDFLDDARGEARRARGG